MEKKKSVSLWAMGKISLPVQQLEALSRDQDKGELPKHPDDSKQVGHAIWSVAHPPLWDCVPALFMPELPQEPDVATGHAHHFYTSFPGCKLFCIPIGKMSDFHAVQKFSATQKLLSAPAAQPWFSCPSLSLSLGHKSLLYCHKASPEFISIFAVSLAQSDCCEIPS